MQSICLANARIAAVVVVTTGSGDECEVLPSQFKGEKKIQNRTELGDFVPEE
jgi:hypothetical protein